MAGSRVDKLGTIFTRVSGLLNSGAIKVESKPLWYDVYKAFPPHIEPRLMRPPPELPIINILYPEDYIRARFYNEFGSPGLIDMTNQSSKFKNLSQLFIEKYIEIAKNAKQNGQLLNDDQIFQATETALTGEGFQLRYRKREKSKSETIQLNINEIINE